MTAPWLPQANPGGRNREFIRKVVAQWLADALIPGIVTVYPGTPMEELYEAVQAGSRYAVLVGVHVGEISEDRAALTGPTDPGGKDAHYDVEISIKHRAFSVDSDDWWQAEDDHDRVLDAVKDRFRASGRDLGRPDVILQAADWPDRGSMRSTTLRPYYNEGVRDQWSTIFFTVTQYMQRQP